MKKQTLLIPLASLAAIGAAALLTIGPPRAPALECGHVEIVEKQIDTPKPTRKFSRPPAPPTPVPQPEPAISF